jgi:hypothetical protein
MSNKTRTRKTRTTSTTTTTGSTPTLRSVPDQTTAATVRTDTEDKLWEALHANPTSTAADLSVTAKIGKSTAQKILVKWAADGSVTRTAGIAEGGRRAADLWAITEIDAAPADAAPVDQGDDAPADDADATDTAQADPDSPVPPDATDTDDATPAEGDPTEPTNTEPTDADVQDTADTADTDATDTAEAEPVVAEETEPAEDGAATDADTATDGGGDDKARLAPGALRGMVEDYLRDHPGEEFGPTAIADALGGKSSGAVSNALDKLVEDKTAVKTNDKPRRFALAPAEAVAAPAPTS